MTEHRSDELPAVYARDLEVDRADRPWLIETLWSRSAVGVLGGPAKCYKTFLGLDFAVSVASGTPALGLFPVRDPGTALAYLAEDALHHVRARIEGLCRHRALDLNNLPLALITAPVLRLDTPGDQDRLRATLARFTPRLLLLDPLVRLHARDENDATQIAGLLGYFRELQRTFDVAIIIVHHTSKKQRTHPGLALRGSSDLHAFGDSNAYLARQGDQISLTVEHRSAKPPPPVSLTLVSAPDGSAAHLEVSQEPAQPPCHASIEDLIVAALRNATAPVPRTELRAELRINNQRLGEALGALARRQEIQRTPRGWTLNHADPLKATAKDAPNGGTDALRY
jgi:hypothetical protein